MYLTLRIDLDYVPWDTPDAQEFGHGEPAMVLKLLDLAREIGVGYHFFASNRVLRAFPAEVEAVLTEGHELDWLCKHPEEFSDRYETASGLFESLGHPSIGWATKASWPESLVHAVLPPEVKFLSCNSGPVPSGPHHFVVEARSARDAIRSGLGAKAWADSVKTLMRASAAVGKPVTIPIRPQVLARYDAKLHAFRDMIELGKAIGLKPTTYREILKAG